MGCVKMENNNVTVKGETNTPDKINTESEVLEN